MDAVEREVHRANTWAFILDRPTSITLTPRTKTTTPSGGSKWDDGEPREAQTMRIIELGMTTTPQIVRTQDGSQREATFWLLGKHDSTMAAGDRFTDSGQEWEIGEVLRPNGYEQRAVVVRRG